LVVVADREGVFQDFQGRGVASSLDHDPLSAHLFFQSGQRWRDMRVKLAPTFTTGKIKYMFNAIKSASVQLNVRS
jgi:cytochrome P450 family 6